MTATTLGDLFPLVRHAVPKQKRPGKTAPHSVSLTTRTGTAKRLKELYPEIESWHPVMATKAWLHWCELNNLKAGEPSRRDERFPEYLVSLIREKMTEMNEWR